MKELLKAELDKTEENPNETLAHAEDGMEHVQALDLIETPMRCFLCDNGFGSIMEIEHHLSEEHKINREALQAFVKCSSNNTAAKEGKNRLQGKLSKFKFTG